MYVIEHTYVRMYIYVAERERSENMDTLIANTLQHAATHSNTQQHTATRGNTRQHTATRCNTLQHAATHCNTLQHTAPRDTFIVNNGIYVHDDDVSTRCNTLQHAATRCNEKYLYRQQQGMRTMLSIRGHLQICLREEERSRERERDGGRGEGVGCREGRGIEGGEKT